MTISLNDRRAGPFAGNGSTTQFSADFPISADADAIVEVRNTSTGVDTIKVLGSDYTITAKTASGFTVVFTTAPSSSEQVIVRAAEAITQDVDFDSFSRFPAEANEGALDKLTREVQDLREIVSRCLAVSPFDGALAGERRIPSLVGHAGQPIIVNGDEDGVTPGDLVTPGTTVSAPMVPVVTAGSLETARDSLFAGDALVNVLTADSLDAAAAALEYRPTGVSSSDGDARSLADRAADEINVLDYVLAADPDHSNAFQRALNKAFQQRGGTVRVPAIAGGYTVNTEVTLTAVQQSVADAWRSGGIRIVGVGGTDRNSIFGGDPLCTIRKTSGSGGIFRFVSLDDCVVEGICFETDSTATDYLVKIMSSDMPNAVGTNFGFRRCEFRTNNTATVDAQVVLSATKLPWFEDCYWPDGESDAVRIGDNAADSPNTFLTGAVHDATFRRCRFQGDIQIRRVVSLLFDSCEFWDKRTALNPGERGVVIYPDGDEEITTVVFLGCNADNSAGTDTGDFFTQGSSGRDLVVIGGRYGDYERGFVLNSGSAAFFGTRFSAMSIADVQLDGNGVELLGHASYSVGVVDNRTVYAGQAAAIRYHASVRSGYDLYANGQAVSVGATTAETALRTITVPGGALGPYGYVEIEAAFSVSNTADDKTCRIRVGGPSGTVVVGNVVTTSASLRVSTVVLNRGAENSQVAPSANGIDSVSGNAVVTAAVDTTADWTIVVSGQKEVSGDTLTLEWVTVRTHHRTLP